VYRAASNLRVDLSQGPAPHVYRTETLRLPPGLNPRAVELAADWAGQSRSRADVVNRALAYFRSEGFSYTLTPPPLLGRHRVDEFLFDTRSGFCEHYSQAFVVLMRAAGVPARVVTGYMGGDRNPNAGYYLVRNSDAHAWAEVLLSDEGGWTRVDPTAAVAPDRIDLGTGTAGTSSFWRDNAWLKALRQRTDALQHWFNSMVVRFDSLAQRQFFSDLGIDASDWRQIGLWMVGGIAAFALVIGVWIYSRRPIRDRTQRRYRRYLKRLQQLGIEIDPAEGPLDLAARAARELPALADAIAAVSAAYAAQRYAENDGADAQLDAALAMFLRRSRAQNAGNQRPTRR
jgi:hypothetical protein